MTKDGTIYQTASILYQTWHVGKLKARCLLEHTCSAVENKALKRHNPSAEHLREITKSVPNRFPSNKDSIGIEIVGEALPKDAKTDDDKKYEAVNSEQNNSLKWLVGQLSLALNIPLNEVFRHPQISRKNKSEAATAHW